MAANKAAAGITSLTDEEIAEIKTTVLNRIKKVEPDACEGTEREIDRIIDFWKEQAKDGVLSYSIPIYKKEDQKRLMAVYGDDFVNEGELETLNSMRDVEASSTMYLWEEDEEEESDK